MSAWLEHRPNQEAHQIGYAFPTAGWTGRENLAVIPRSPMGKGFASRLRQ